jgi:hypothetical protein
MIKTVMSLLNALLGILKGVTFNEVTDFQELCKKIGCAEILVAYVLLYNFTS